MSGPEQIMSVLLDAEDMRLIHRSWPIDMRLGVCLMQSGDCQLMLFHQDESVSFPQRLKDHFGLRASEISIHPQVAGFATHPMKYSEERALANLLSDNQELTEEAQDYSVNFSYAREEGLDPVNFMGRTAEMIGDSEAAPVEAQTLTFSTRRKASDGVKPLRNLHFDLALESQRLEAEGTLRPDVSKPKSATQAIEGFKSAAQLSAIDTKPTDFSVSSTPAGGIDIRAAQGLGPKVTISDGQDVFLRDDRKLLALKLNETSVPEHITILPHAVPSALLASLKSNQESAEVFAQDGYVYVTLGAAKPVATKAAKPVKTRSLKVKKRLAALRLVGLTAMTVLGIYLILGSSLGTAPEATVETAIDWDSLRGQL